MKKIIFALLTAVLAVSCGNIVSPIGPTVAGGTGTPNEVWFLSVAEETPVQVRVTVSIDPKTGVGNGIISPIDPTTTYAVKIHTAPGAYIYPVGTIISGWVKTIGYDNYRNVPIRVVSF